jgi:hypothetical protein
MDDGRRRAALAAWLAIDLPARFAERILPIDHAVAEHRGDLTARSPPKRRCAVRGSDFIGVRFTGPATDRSRRMQPGNSKTRWRVSHGLNFEMKRLREEFFWRWRSPG